MSNKMTPGPWFQLDGRPKIHSGAVCATTTGGTVCIAKAMRTNVPSYEAEANAQAIAALPDLIEALQKCRLWFDRFQPGNMEVTIKAALKKAGIE